MTRSSELLSFYYRLSEQNLDWPAFHGCFWEAAVQRLMQALGAYGFLGLTKGLTAFLAHIPPGLNNLIRAASHAASLPLLSELSQSCLKKIEQNNLLLCTQIITQTIRSSLRRWNSCDDMGLPLIGKG